MEQTDDSVLRLFRIERNGEETIERLGRTKAWGVEFPSGACVVDWKLDAYPDHQRLTGPHVSHYSHITDVLTATNGIVEPILEVEAEHLYPDEEDADDG